MKFVTGMCKLHRLIRIYIGNGETDNTCMKVTIFYMPEACIIQTYYTIQWEWYKLSHMYVRWSLHSVHVRSIHYSNFQVLMIPCIHLGYINGYCWQPHFCYIKVSMVCKVSLISNFCFSWAKNGYLKSHWNCMLTSQWRG